MYYYLIKDNQVVGMTDSPANAPEGFEVRESETYIDPSMAIVGSKGLETFTPGNLTIPTVTQAAPAIPKVLFDWAREASKESANVLTEFTIALHAVSLGDSALLQGALEELKTLFKADQPADVWNLIE